MFANFIYFIIVLVIYATYQPAAERITSVWETVFLFLMLLAAFAGVTWAIFRIMARRVGQRSDAVSDMVFHQALNRLSILAILAFFVDIYVLNLPSIFAGITGLDRIPTLQALLFIGLFIVKLVIIWACAYEVHQKLYPGRITRRMYIESQLAFALPVLMPWFVLSFVADFIDILPFERLQHFLSTPFGEFGYILVFMILFVITGPVLIQKVWRCQPLEAGFARRRIEQLCQKARLKYAEILKWPLFGENTLTAAVMGIVGRFRYILVSPALLSFLEPEELDAVIAHETGHVKKKHLLLYLLFFIGYVFVYFIFFEFVLCFVVLSGPVFRLIVWSGMDAGTVSTAMMGAVLVMLLILYFRYFFGFVMRNFERQADLYVYDLLENAKPLISAFRKIGAASGQPLDRPNWHHFSIQQRIDYLLQCEADRSWIRRHHRKVRGIIGGYLAGLILVSGVGYLLNYGDIGQSFRQYCTQRNYSYAIELLQDDPKRFSLLGGLYYSMKDYEKTIEAYERAIAQNPEDAESLNNLAWLYATCEDERFRNPSRALQLAQQAVDLQPVAHILDTLAESFFVNGHYEAAIKVEQRALQAAEGDQGYYQKQLEKFRALLRETRPAG